ncbi:hypothetical protein L7F22_062649 [Adiantum nelumboides]|nr:hypothetical protein [Adiantum nelumboides]
MSPLNSQKLGDEAQAMLIGPNLHIAGPNQSKSCIIEHHNLTEQAYQLVSSVPEEEPLFQPFPPEVIFSGYDPFGKYTAVLQLRNNDKAMRRVQVLTVDPETITVHQPYDQGNEMFVDMGTNKVACGMKVTYIVTFCPESDEDYQSELVVVTDREKFIVPVRCFGRKRTIFLSYICALYLYRFLNYLHLVFLRSYTISNLKPPISILYERITLLAEDKACVHLSFGLDPFC